MIAQWRPIATFLSVFSLTYRNHFLGMIGTFSNFTLDLFYKYVGLRVTPCGKIQSNIYVHLFRAWNI